MKEKRLLIEKALKWARKAAWRGEPEAFLYYRVAFVGGDRSEETRGSLSLALQLIGREKLAKRFGECRSPLEHILRPVLLTETERVRAIFTEPLFEREEIKSLGLEQLRNSEHRYLCDSSPTACSSHNSNSERQAKENLRPRERLKVEAKPGERLRAEPRELPERLKSEAKPRKLPKRLKTEAKPRRLPERLKTEAEPRKQPERPKAESGPREQAKRKRPESARAGQKERAGRRRPERVERVAQKSGQRERVGRVRERVVRTKSEKMPQAFTPSRRLKTPCVSLPRCSLDGLKEGHEISLQGCKTLPLGSTLLIHLPCAEGAIYLEAEVLKNEGMLRIRLDIPPFLSRWIERSA